MVNYYSGNDVLVYQAFAFLSAWGVLLLALVVLGIVAGWKIFSKAGEPGWGSLVPFYNSYIEFKIFWGNGWLFLAPIALALLSVAPIIGPLFTLINIVLVVMTKYKKSLAFGEGIGFCLGLVFVPTIFNLILGLSKKYEYLGVPQDGVTYKDLKKKYDDINDRPVTFEPKPEEAERPMEYEKASHDAPKTTPKQVDDVPETTPEQASEACEDVSKTSPEPEGDSVKEDVPEVSEEGSKEA